MLVHGIIMSQCLVTSVNSSSFNNDLGRIIIWSGRLRILLKLLTSGNFILSHIECLWANFPITRTFWLFVYFLCLAILVKLAVTYHRFWVYVRVLRSQMSTMLFWVLATGNRRSRWVFKFVHCLVRPLLSVCVRSVIQLISCHAWSQWRF
jgi:hypothetical protein